MINLRFCSKKIRLVILIFVICVIAGVIFVKQKDKDSDITFREDKVEIGNIHVEILATGTVQPENRVEIKPPIPGRIERILITEGQIVKKGQIVAWMSSTERAALLDTARAKGDEEIKKWEDIYPPTPIVAPLSGTIILKSMEQGETFTSGDSLMAISDRLIVKAQLDETDIAAIELDQDAKIILDAYADQEILAKVDKIAFEAVTVSNVTTYLVDVLPNSVPPFIRSGMTANVTFLVNSKKDVLLIPSEALKIEDGKTVVLVVDNYKKVQREIVTGAASGKKIEVISGLKVGEVVLSPQINAARVGENGSPFSPMRGSKKPKK